MNPSPARILLVEDDARFAELILGDLKSHGYGVEWRYTVAEAFQCAVSWSPQVIILDHFLPDGLGRDLCARLRSLGIPSAIVMLTTATELSNRVQGLDAGADDYLCKPFPAEELQARVRAQLRRAAPRELPDTAAASLVQALRGTDAGQRAAALESIRAVGGGLRFQMFGDFRVEWRGVELSGVLWNRRIPRVLLKLLLLGYDRRQPTDILIDRLWPDEDADFGRRNLKVNVQRLRTAFQMFGSERVERVDDGYRLALGADDVLDLRDFDAAVGDIRACLTAPAAVERLPAALARLLDLYRGGLLEDEPYAEWAEAERAGALTRCLDVAEAAIRACRAAGLVDEAAAAAGRLRAIAPDGLD